MLYVRIVITFKQGILLDSYVQCAIFQLYCTVYLVSCNDSVPLSCPMIGSNSPYRCSMSIRIAPNSVCTYRSPVGNDWVCSFIFLLWMEIQLNKVHGSIRVSDFGQLCPTQYIGGSWLCVRHRHESIGSEANKCALYSVYSWTDEINSDSTSLWSKFEAIAKRYGVWTPWVIMTTKYVTSCTYM